MSVTVTAVTQLTGFPPRSQTSLWDVIATADGDTIATITHGLPFTPQFATITPLLQAVALLSGWAITAFGATTLTLTKSTTSGSGNAGAQIRVKVEVPHSLTQ